MKFQITPGFIDTYPDVLKVQDVADILRINRSTAYRLVAKGSLDSIKVGTSYRISKKSLIRFLSPTKK